MGLKTMLKGGALAAVIMAALPAAAQDRGQTLADVRQELTVLSVELQRLKGELNTTSGAAGTGGAGSMLDRVNALEAALSQLTGKTEELQFKVESVARDGATRLDNLSFRLCELESDCDIMNEKMSKPLGGVAAGAVAPAPVTPAAPASAVTGLSEGIAGQLAIGEKADFEAAVASLDAGNFADAAERLARVVDSYPGSPLTPDAQFLRGEALSGQGMTADAARAYLASFSANESGPRAADALLNLGTALGQLGQTSEACATLGEVLNRFPNSAAAPSAQTERQGLGCS